MKTLRYILFSVTLLSVGAMLLSACGSTASQTGIQPTATVNQSFQSQQTPVPTAPPYRCGAWSSNNAPNSQATITIYARITKNIAPVSGANASAVVHFKGFDQPLQAQGASDSGGYVTFTLQLQGRQPSQVPATVDVTFNNVPGRNNPLRCTPAFFTPQ
ncbi:MAG: hypothetical protein ACJ788_13445 [Ktedonobacteraceae bacterium]